MTCSQCGGDVVRIFVGTTEKYIHAVRGIDHGPLPRFDSEIGAGPRPPVRPRPDDTSGRPAPLSAPELFPEVPGP